MKKVFIFLAIALSVPQMAFALDASDFPSLVSSVISFIGMGIIPLLMLAALMVFFWGLVVFIYKAGSDPAAVAQGKTFMFWGIIALFVMSSVWGLVAFIGDTFGIKQVVPQLGGRSGSLNSTVNTNRSGPYVDSTGRVYTGGNTSSNPFGSGSSNGGYTDSTGRVYTGGGY